MSERIGGYCPRHEYERKMCRVDCLDARIELWRIGRALSSLWFDRKRGMGVQR